MRKVGLAVLLIGLGLVIVGIVIAATTVTTQGGSIMCGNPLYRDNLFKAVDACREVIQDRARVMWALFILAAPVLSTSFVMLFLSAERTNDAIRTADLNPS